MTAITTRLLLPLLFASASLTASAQPQPVGLWSFDDPADLTAAEIGLSLQLTGTHEAVTGVDEPDGAARIDIGSHYVCEHGIAANGGGSLVNEYTFVYELK